MPDFRQLPILVQIQLAGVMPFLAGAVCGFLLGISEVAWWISQVVVTAAGVVGGTELRETRSAALRGAVAGTMLGLGIVCADAASGDVARAPFPSPSIAIVAVTALGGVVAGSAGAILGRLVRG
jgi:hypothetical protein